MHNPTHCQFVLMLSKSTTGQAIFFTAAIATSVAYGKTPQEIFEHNNRSVLVVLALDEYGDTVGQGSGVVISSSLVATNCHVLEDGSKVVAQHYDTADIDTYYEMDAETVASNADRDICILRVSELSSEPAAQPVEIGSTSNMAVGDEVYALGSPLDLGISFSRGIVSQLRSKPKSASAPYIQTDAAISPGSSGGALFDTNGMLVGITTFKFAGEYAEGLTFALPVEWVLELVYAQLPNAKLGID